MASYEDFKYVENNVTKTLSDLININSDLKSDYCRSFHNYYKLDGDSTKYYCAYAYFDGPKIKSYPLVLNGELTMHRPVVRFPWGRPGIYKNLFYNMPAKDNTEGLNASYKEGSPIPKRVHANPALATSSIGCLHINNLSSTTTLQYDSTNKRVIITHPSRVQEVKLKNHVFIIDIQAPGGSGAAAAAGKTLTWEDNYSGGGGGGGGACVGDDPQSGAAGGNGYINIYW